MNLSFRSRSFFGRATLLAAFASLSLVTVAARTASAAPIIYGNKLGTNVDYLGVQEESVTDPGTGPFGNPGISGDTLDFNPQAFAATATGVAADTIDSNLQFTIMAKPGKGISNIQFTEAGDTTLTGLAGEAQTTVNNTLFVEITQVQVGNVFTSVNLNVPAAAMVFAPKSLFKLTVDGSGAKSWSGSALINLLPILAANGYGNGFATKVFVSLNNTLTAASVAGTSAFIQKKDADGLTVTVNVPEPTSAATALIGLMFGGGLMRRRRL